MKINIHKIATFRVVTALVMLVATLTAVPSRAVDVYSEAVECFVNSSLTDPQSVAVVVYDLEKGDKTESYNAGVALIPASIMKTVSIATCLNSTGIDYRYVTPAYIEGKIHDGTLDGNIVIVGSGDPSLGAKPEPTSEDFALEIVAALQDAGINHVTGQILFDQSVFPLPATPPSWAAGDLPNSYGAGCFGFNFANNSCGKASVANPALVFERHLRAEMSAAGIQIDWEPRDSSHRTLIAEHVSPTIDDIMRSCMRRSDNMYAEALLRTYALSVGSEASTANAATLETDYWNGKGIDMEGVNLVDGSGLSRQNRLTADFLAQLLVRMSDNIDYVSFFPLAGQEGTLRSFLKDTDLDSYIALKTGSMNGIQCYAGYKLDYEYAPTHVVVVMINNMTSPRASVRKEVEKMLLEIFKD